MECPSLKVQDLLGKLGAAGEPHTADTLEQFGARVYWQAWQRRAVLQTEGTPAGCMFLAFRYAPRWKAQADGSRPRVVFFVCPHCSRQVKAVYASRWRPCGSAAVWAGDWRKEPGEVLQSTLGGGLLGCVDCLGLAYPSSQEHKTPSGDGRLLQMGKAERWQKRRQGLALERACYRLGKRAGMGQR